MGTYHVNHRYRASRDGRQFGPFEAGQTLELDDADAEWIERDSPGCLTAAADGWHFVDDSAEEEPPPAPNRQHKPTRKRAAS